MTAGDLARAIQKAGNEQHDSVQFYFDCEDANAAILDMRINLQRVAEILSNKHER